MDRVRNAMRRHKSVLMQSATGSGKTMMAASMMRSGLQKGSRAVFMVPRRELLRQTAETLDNHDIAHGFVAAGYTANPFAKIHLATTGTIARRLDKAPTANVLFVDETHFGSTQVAAVIDHYLTRGAWRSEEHTSELQSRLHLVCRLLLEKKNKKNKNKNNNNNNNNWQYRRFYTIYH